MTETATAIATLPTPGTVGPRKITRPKTTVITYETRHLLKDVKVDGVIKPMTRSQMSISLNGNPLAWEFTAYSKFGASMFDGKDKKFTPSLGVAFPIERNAELKEMEELLLSAIEKQLVQHWNKLWKPEVPEDRRLERVRDDYLSRMSKTSKTDKGKTFGANFRAKITNKTKLFTDESDVPIPEDSFKKKVEGMYTVFQDIPYVDVTQPSQVFIMCYTNRLLLHLEADEENDSPFQTVKFRNPTKPLPSSPKNSTTEGQQQIGKKRKNMNQGESPEGSSPSSPNGRRGGSTEGEGEGENDRQSKKLKSEELNLNSAVLGNPTPLLGLDD